MAGAPVQRSAEEWLREWQKAHPGRYDHLSPEHFTTGPLCRFQFFIQLAFVNQERAAFRRKEHHGRV